MAKIVVDPITRIEGHLRIEAEVNDGRITDAWSSSTMFRGIEKILQGRDPRDAWFLTQRFCGVCTTVHSIASIRERGECPRHQDPAQCGTDQEHHHRYPECSGPRDPFLPPPCPRLGRYHLGPQGRSGQDRGAGGLHLRLAAQLRHLLQGGAGQTARPLSARVGSVPLPTPTGDIRPTSSRPRPT